MTAPLELALVDTSVIIDFPRDEVSSRTRSVAISTITLAELAYGLHTPDPLVNAMREQRYHWVRNTFDPIPYDVDAARVYGALAAAVRVSGRDPRPRRSDLLIASVAVTLGVALITRNDRDFQGLHRALTVIGV